MVDRAREMARLGFGYRPAKERNYRSTVLDDESNRVIEILGTGDEPMRPAAALRVLIDIGKRVVASKHYPTIRQLLMNETEAG
jgi:hypothetical protein